MRKRTGERAPAERSGDSFRALKPDKLSASILALCQEIVAEEQANRQHARAHAHGQSLDAVAATADANAQPHHESDRLEVALHD